MTIGGNIFKVITGRSEGRRLVIGSKVSRKNKVLKKLRAYICYTSNLLLT